METRGVFFDLGGTLFSYRNVAKTNIPLLIESAERLDAAVDEATVKASYAQASHEVGKRYAEMDFYFHRELFGDMYRRFVELIGATYRDDVHDWYRETQREAMIQCLEIKPGCIEILEYLKDQGLYLSIVSNIDDDMLEPLVEREGLHDYFDHWTSSESARSCKPHPAFFELTLGKSGLAAHEVLFVGDSPEHDIAGANTAGMRSVLIVEEGIEPPLQSGSPAGTPDHVIQHLEEIRALVT